MMSLKIALDKLDASCGVDAIGAMEEVVRHARIACRSGMKRRRDESIGAPTSRQLGICVNSTRSVLFKGLTYPSVQNAFQAQKAARQDRTPFTTCDPWDAARLGRECVIDVSAWDANRRKLMKAILSAQVSQHSEMRKILRSNPKIEEETLLDPFWMREMPKIWKEISDESGDRSGTEDEESEEEQPGDLEIFKSVYGRQYGAVLPGETQLLDEDF